MGKALVPDNKLAADEIRFIIGISFILGLRQFGMMLVMPFLSVYGMTLSGASSASVGISLGIYALTQGCLQVPYGIIRDRIDRKPVIFFGMLLQIAGFILAFKAKSIQLLIFARALQGSGAINSVALSWVGDRFCGFKGSRAMRMISTVSSVAIALSLICGTILQGLGEFFLVMIVFLASLAVIAYFRKNKQFNFSLWATLIAPIFGAIGVAFVLIKAVLNFTVLTNAPGIVSVVIFTAIMLIAIGGLCIC